MAGGRCEAFTGFFLHVTSLIVSTCDTHHELPVTDYTIVLLRLVMNNCG